MKPGANFEKGADPASDFRLTFSWSCNPRKDF